MNEHRNSSQMEFLQRGIAVIDLSHFLCGLESITSDNIALSTLYIHNGSDEALM